MATFLSILSVMLLAIKDFLNRQDRKRLLETGRMNEVARATRELLEIVGKVNEVDGAILGNNPDLDWVNRVYKLAKRDGSQ